jgi:hypothetical protein
MWINVAARYTANTMAGKPISTDKKKLSPVSTFYNVTEELIKELSIPSLPDNIPQRLEDALVARIEALLFHLREAKAKRYIRALQIRLARDTQRAVLTAYELHVRNAEAYYATFRGLLEELGFEKTDVGFMLAPETELDE